MIKRALENKVLQLLTHFPCVALIGPRQVGKTTLAKLIGKKLNNETLYLDLELTSDLNKLEDAEYFLRQNSSKTIIIDEIQRKSDIFPVLRALIDENRIAGRFIIVVSASPELINKSNESLAGRIAYVELNPFILPEVKDIDKLWIFGGYPDAFLNIDIWNDWMNSFISTYVNRDLPALGLNADTKVSERLWTMIAHNHGNLINRNDFSKSLEIDSRTLNKYIDFLEKAFLIRQLQPYHFNIKKRIVKSPKIYIRDTGVLHHLLGLSNMNEVLGHYKMGNSWESFVIEQITAMLPGNYKTYFYRTHDDSELDLVIEKGGKPYVGIEIKYGSNVKVSKGNTLAAKSLETKHNFIVTKEDEDYTLSNGFRVCGLNKFLNHYLVKL